MDRPGLLNVAAAVRGAPVVRQTGRLDAVGEGVLRVTGLARAGRLGERVTGGVGAVGGEIVGAADGRISVLLDRSPAGLIPGDRVLAEGAAALAPDPSWIGRIVDPAGRPLDGRPLLPGAVSLAHFAAAPAAATRRAMGARLSTGLRAFNTVLPIVRGQRIGLFAGSGVGKSSLLAAFARGIEADVVVLALIGERGREMRDFVERALGPEGMARTVVIAATADRPAADRARCLPAALAVAERFRDDGRHVLLLADSITRHAEAHRQMAAARGEAPVIAGFPASTAPEMAALEVDDIRDIIREIGLAPTKAKNLKRMAEQLVERHDGEVPQTFAELEELAGVGHKTASVVMVQAFGIPAFPVDTHIHRLSARWGLSNGRNVVQTERDLKRHFPEDEWARRHLQIIYFGRERCPARFHDLNECPICSFAASKARIRAERQG